jgi:hypothetical protein
MYEKIYFKLMDNKITFLSKLLKILIQQKDYHALTTSE